MKQARVIVPFPGRADNASTVRQFVEGDLIEGDLAAVAVREKWAVDASSPTIEEWVSAGYKAHAYPPRGYEAISAPEDVNAAIIAEVDAGGKLHDLTVAQLTQYASDLEIELGDETKKDDIVAAIELAMAKG